MNELNDYFRRTQGYSLLDPNLDAAATTLPAATDLPAAIPTPSALPQATPSARDQFDFTPTPQQEKQALYSSLARMGAAMLTNNRGPNSFANALGSGLSAQQEGYQNALNLSEAQNTKALQSQMLRSNFAEQQRQRVMQQGLRTAIGQLDQNDPDYWGQVGRLYAAAGDMDTALKANEAAQGGKPTEAQRNFNYLTGTLNVPPSKAIGVFTPMAPQPLQYVPPTENRPGGFVNIREGTTNFNEPPIPQKQKDIPPTTLKAIADNRATLAKFDNTITALENAVKTGSDALGWKNKLPYSEEVRQRTDKEGVPLRAMVSDVGSALFHERSGAAVTATESPRLKPFAPSTDDRPEVALEKLKLLRANVANETNALADMYPSDQGYKPLAPWTSPRSAQPQRQTSPAASPVQAAFGSIMSMASVQALADRRKEPVDAVAKALKAKGVRIQ
jgi:hypothetical protein